jgi:hypothetical protein
MKIPGPIVTFRIAGTMMLIGTAIIFYWKLH